MAESHSQVETIPFLIMLFCQIVLALVSLIAEALRCDPQGKLIYGAEGHCEGKNCVGVGQFGQRALRRYLSIG